MKRFTLLLSCVFLLSFSKNKPAEASLNKLIDEWHLSATNADFEAYFGLMADDFVFLGTAPEERWDKKTFAAFSRPYFDKGKAWDFKAIKRNWNFSPDGKTAWFDEMLTTWMDEARATGILVYERKEWKLKHYNLHVLIENEKMDAFLLLRRKD